MKNRTVEVWLEERMVTLAVGIMKISMNMGTLTLKILINVDPENKINEVAKNKATREWSLFFKTIDFQDSWFQNLFGITLMMTMIVRLVVLSFTLNVLKTKGEAKVTFRETHLHNDSSEVWLAERVYTAFINSTLPWKKFDCLLSQQVDASVVLLQLTFRSLPKTTIAMI